jgi:hypothetical protein
MSPLDDLTFDLNFDPATAAQIRELDVAKERAGTHLTCFTHPLLTLLALLVQPYT